MIIMLRLIIFNTLTKKFIQLRKEYIVQVMLSWHNHRFHGVMKRIIGHLNENVIVISFYHFVKTLHCLYATLEKQ